MIDPNKIKYLSEDQVSKATCVLEIVPREIFFFKSNGSKTGQVLDIHGRARIADIRTTRRFDRKKRTLIKLEIQSFGLSDDREYAKAFKEAPG